MLREVKWDQTFATVLVEKNSFTDHWWVELLEFSMSN
jgi:hypothetical protein